MPRLTPLVSDTEYLQFRRNELLNRARQLMGRFRSTGNRSARRSIEVRYRDVLREIQGIDQQLCGIDRTPTVAFEETYDFWGNENPSPSLTSLHDLLAQQAANTATTIDSLMFQRYDCTPDAAEQAASNGRYLGLHLDMVTAPCLTEYQHKTQVQHGKDFGYKMELYTVE